MMRGDRENECLTKLKKNIFCRYNDGNLCQSDDPKTIFDVSDDEYAENRYLYAASGISDKYFGLKEEDCIEFENAVRKAKPNTNASEFPDFTFESGFIEHFQVSASKLTRKGDEQHRIMTEYEKTVEKHENQFEIECNTNPIHNSIRMMKHEIENPQYSYTNLHDSFMRLWNKHCECINSYNGCKRISIFMIEYDEHGLLMIQNAFAKWENDMFCGDYISSNDRNYIINHYRLSRDKDLLHFIYGFKETIQYVAFIYNGNAEIIKVSSIPYLLTLLPYKYSITSATITSCDIIQCMHIKME